MRARHLALALVLSLSACGGRSELGLPLLADPNAPSCGAPWVLFTLQSDTTSQIYARRADGSEGHALALPDPQPSYPSVSPDGTELLYAHTSTQHLSLYRFADHSHQQLATQGMVGRGSVSPDGTLVVYGDGISLHLVGVDGSPSEMLLVVEPEADAAGFPSFTADSQSVVFAALGVVQSIGVDGSSTHTLLTTDDTTVEFPNPTLSPDYQRLAEVGSCDGASIELRTYALSSLPATCASGAIVTTVTDPMDYYDPSWGPTGLIAFAVGRDVLVVKAGGGTPTNLTADLTGTTMAALTPTWAPACVSLP